MNVKELAKSIFSPEDKKVSIEGNLSEDSPLHSFLGNDLFKKIVTGTFIACIMLSSAGSALAQTNPIDLIKPPQNIEVTQETSVGSHFESPDDNGFLLLFKKGLEVNNQEYEGKININLDYTSDYFAYAGFIPSVLDGLDVSDFEGISEQSIQLKNYVDIRSTPIHMTQANMYQAGRYINNVFSKAMDGINVSLMSESEIDLFANKILLNIHSNKNAGNLLKRSMDVADQTYSKYGAEITEIGFVKNLILSNADEVSQSIKDLGSFKDMKESFSTKAMVDSAKKSGFDEIYSNIGEHYNLDKTDIKNMMDLFITLHEYVHMIDYAKNISYSELGRSDTPKSNDNTVNDFNFSVKKEALADLSAIPIAVAIYAKQTNKSPSELSDAIVDIVTLFRSSTFDGYGGLDSHIGAVNASLYWNDHRDELISQSSEIFNGLPSGLKKINFERDIADNVVSIYREIA